MVYKRYKSPFEESPEEKAQEEFVPQKEPPLPPEKEDAPKHQNENLQGSSLGFLDSLAYDDIILIGLIIILLAEDREKRDVPAILALGFLFLIQYIDAD